jgi:hypothetical protein
MKSLVFGLVPIDFKILAFKPTDVDGIESRIKKTICKKRDKLRMIYKSSISIAVNITYLRSNNILIVLLKSSH